MSKKIKQDYEEQKRQAAENNSINQLETFHAGSMTMEAHKSKEMIYQSIKRRENKMYSFDYILFSVRKIF